MLTRTITGCLFVAAIIAGIYFNEIIAIVLFSLIVLLGVDEFFGLVKKSKEVKPIRFWGTICAVALFLTSSLIIIEKITLKMAIIPFAMLFLTFFIELFRKNQNPFYNISYTIIGSFYIAIPFTMLFHLGYYNNGFTNEYNYQVILGFFFLLWTSDTGAYLSGKFLGKHKLFERISPKKTWEGSIGSLVFTSIIAYVISLYYSNLSLVNWIVIGVLIVVFGGLGDLVESMLKRSLKVKDSGNILPGHGGILDRFDGLLLSIPFVYTYLLLIM